MKLFERKVLTSHCGDPYLVRYTVIETPLGSVKLHHILRSDEDTCCHDHPWSFLSIILWGGYDEERMVPQERGFPTREEDCALCQRGLYRYDDGDGVPYHIAIGDEHPCTATRRALRWYGPGSVLWRPAPWPHRLELAAPCWTLVFMGRRVREWGFLTPRGWVQWARHLAGKDAPC